MEIFFSAPAITGVSTAETFSPSLADFVSVVSGAVCGYAFNSAQCSHEALMLLPSTTWGTEIPFVSLSTNLGVTDHMVLAAEDDTTLYVNGVLIGKFDMSDYYLFYGGEYFINATKRINVIEFAGTRNDGQGAPFFVNAPATSQFVEEAVQFATGQSDFEQQNVQYYVRIITDEFATGHIAVDSVKPQAVLYTRIGNSHYFYYDQRVSAGYHEVAPAMPVRFSVMVYGYGPNTAYAFVPGLQLKAVGTC